MIVHLVDGTYELFRHFYGIRRFRKTDPPLGAVAGVLNSIVKMMEEGAKTSGSFKRATISASPRRIARRREPSFGFSAATMRPTLAGTPSAFGV